MKNDGLDISCVAQSVEFQEFFQILHRVLSIAPCLRTPDGELYRAFHVENPWAYISPVCSLVLGTPEGWEACEKTNRLNCRLASQQKRPIHYYCHAGLVDFMVPIYFHGKLVAHINGGQLITQPINQKGFGELYANLKGIPVDQDKLRARFFRCVQTPAERIPDIVRLVAFFTEFFCEMSQRLASKDDFKAASEIRAAEDFIKDHFREEITRNQIADHIDLSPNYFSHLFVKAMGETFSSYLNRMRVDYAKKLLQKTEQPITQVAFESGFGSLCHFNQVFKKCEQCSPRMYRKNTKPSGTS